MGTLENINHETITDLADATRQVLEVNTLSRTRFNDKPANHCVILNKSNQVLVAEMNGSPKQRYILDSTNGSIVIEKDDLIHFASLDIVNESGATATGNVYITTGWLYEEFM